MLRGRRKNKSKVWKLKGDLSGVIKRRISKSKEIIKGLCEDYRKRK